MRGRRQCVEYSGLRLESLRHSIRRFATPRRWPADHWTVTENMRRALLATYEAVPSPKLVIAVGACAISGGPYIDHPEAHNGADHFLPVDLYLPGCPPSLWTILDGSLRLLGQLEG